MTKPKGPAHLTALLVAAALGSVWLGGCAPRPSRQVLSVAAAADLRFALEDLARGFRAAHPQIDLRIAYGSSGNFFAQIRSRAPFDVFLSADAQYPRELLQLGIGVPDSFFIYAIGRIVVWVPASSPLDPATVLRSGAVTHFAIANPQHAPYGRAAEAALHTLGVYDRLKDKLVLGENITQTLEFVESGAAGAGIVALSLARAPSVRAQGRYWELPPQTYPKMEQAGLLIDNRPAAREFRAWLLAPAAARVLQQYGFALPTN